MEPFPKPGWFFTFDLSAPDGYNKAGEIFNMPTRGLRAVLPVLFGFAVTLFSVSQENSAGEGDTYRGSIPEILMRPQRGEAPRYPVDTVIGPLGRGEASEAAYLFARKVSAALTAGNRNDSSLQGMNSVSLEAFISELSGINPLAWRLGGGREEPDGAVSFLVRFLGRERGITGELYIRLQDFEPAGDSPRQEAGAAGTVETAGLSGESGGPETAGQAAEAPAAGAGDADSPAPETGGTEGRVSAGPPVWIFEDLILEESRERDREEERQQFDFPPYERLF
jgi:hypothetical protein